MAEIKRHPSVRSFQALGRVEGILKNSPGSPREGVSVSVLPSPPMGSKEEFSDFHSSATTAGRWQLRLLRPSGRRLYVVSLSGLSPSVQPDGADHRGTSIAGSPLKLERRWRFNTATAGRQVIGEALPENPYVDVDWLNDDHTLTLKQSSLSSPPSVNLSDFASTKALSEAARDQASNPPRYLRQMREARTYVLDCDLGGSFHVDDRASRQL